MKMGTNIKPISSLSLDMDNQWAYMRSSKIPGWETYPSYLDIAVPRSLALFDRLGLKITYFVIGRDASHRENREALAAIPASGHEVANHSFDHEPWLHLYSRDELIEEFDRAEEAIGSATGVRPRGFRGPGFSLSPAVIEILAERGYDYDASTFPTFIGPLARAYYFFKSEDMTKEEREQRKKLFGKISDGFRPLKPYLIETEGRRLVEVPVTTLPGLKTPIHVSYLMYLASFSPFAARTYWRTALRMCRLAGVEPSILLHPLDFLGAEDVEELRFFPGMALSWPEKNDLLQEIIERLSRSFSVVPMCEHAEDAKGRDLAIRTAADI